MRKILGKKDMARRWRKSQSPKRKDSRRSGLVPVDVPMEITCCRFVDGRSDGREVGSNVMLEAAFANEAQQLLQLGDADDAGTTKRFQGILGECAFADVAGDFSFAVVGGKSCVAHRAAFHTPHDGAKGVLFADGS